MCLNAYGRAEVQIHSRLASAIDHFVPDKSLVLFNRGNSNKDPINYTSKRQNFVRP